MKRRKAAALFMALAVAAGTLAGCGGAGNQPAAESKVSEPVEETAGAEETDDTQKESETGQAASGEKVNIKLFTGKIETIDVMNEIIESFNKSQDRITVEQEYQKDASNIIKIKFASDEVPDIMTTYEQGFVDEGKYMDISDQNEWWDRMSPDMKAACTDVKTGKTYRVCTNMTMAGFFYTQPLPAKAGRFGLLLKQPKVCTLKVISYPFLLPYLKVIGIALLLQILILNVRFDYFIRHISTARYKISPCP